MGERRIRALTLLVDGKWHTRKFDGMIVGLGKAEEWPVKGGAWTGHIEVLVLDEGKPVGRRRQLRAFKTDEVVPAEADYVGTVVFTPAPDQDRSAESWHVMQKLVMS